MNAIPKLAIIGGGPAGLMAAETAAADPKIQIDVYDAMPSVGRKFLLAGKGGLNLTHAEPFPAFIERYGTRRAVLEAALTAFGPDTLRNWAQALGVDTFVGSSGRVFPTAMKAAPLLRAWLRRLRESGVNFHMRHRWHGWDAAGHISFDTPQGPRTVQADAVILALGGGSWARLGSDGAWVPLLTAQGIPVAPLLPANCGFDVGWSEHFRSRFEGHAVKAVAVTAIGPDGDTRRRVGEFVITATGIESGAIYALSSLLRDAIAATGDTTLYLDLAPDRDLDRLTQALAQPRGTLSLANHLKRRAGIAGVKAGLARELLPATVFAEPESLAAALKALPVRLIAPRPLDEAISSAGGVAFEALDSQLMLIGHPGVFCAGEMLDWEAPTGGYLLTGCFATGRLAGLGAKAWLEK